MTLINSLCGQNAELMIVKVGVGVKGLMKILMAVT
jgi:hypothetical protein